MESLKDELRRHQLNLGLARPQNCTKEECSEYWELVSQKLPLPEGVMRNERGWFVRLVEIDLTEESLAKLFLYRQTAYLKSIMNGVYFFVILTIISLVLLIYAISVVLG
ncbi:hypothetical protein FACS1894188_03400 [Clostridia bacterium]|nr:hypothetical protein FACS1894188_03400 [Clostridia bacterium]